MSKIFSIVGALLIISSSVFAGGIDDPSSSKIVVSKSGSVVKVFCKSEAKNVKVSITNEKGTVIFAENIRNSKKGFVRPYNLSQLGTGEFTFSMEDENGKRQETVVIEKPVPVLTSAIIKLRDKKCAITLAGQNDAEAVITVKNEQGKVLFTERYQSNGTATKMLDLSGFAGSLTVSVANGAEQVASRVIE